MAVKNYKEASNKINSSNFGISSGEGSGRFQLNRLCASKCSSSCSSNCGSQCASKCGSACSSACAGLCIGGGSSSMIKISKDIII